MTEVHNFADSLARSHAQADAPWWPLVYRQAFHNVAAMVDVRTDGWWQRAGIDRVLTLTSSKTIWIDEKVREKDWPDFALEYWSDRDRKAPGWVAKDLACDYIAYAFIPSQTCYLLPFLSLRRSWRLRHREWVNTYQNIEAQNNGYVTVSVCVPIEVVMRALGDAMCISWKTEVA